jgi:RNA polymerase sigma factor (sigma-70 family)
MDNSNQLLQSYANKGAEKAFEQLVFQHVGLVYGVALRCLNGDTALAQDVSQIVFLSLARKAKTLDSDTNMNGWLYRHAFHTATRMARTEKRRRGREIRAASEEAPGASDTTPGEEANVDRLVSELLAGLAAKDRAALLLRFYEERSFREIGDALEVSEDAAQKRVSRALEKMRRKLETFTTRGTGSALAAYLSRVGAAQIPASLPTRILQQLTGSAWGVTSIIVSMKTRIILAIAAIGAVAIPIVVTLQNRTSDISLPSDPPVTATPLAPHPEPAVTLSLAEKWERIKANPDRLKDVIAQCTLTGKQILDAKNAVYRQTISSWQETAKLLAGPDMAEPEDGEPGFGDNEAAAERLQKKKRFEETMTGLSTRAKELEREMAGWRSRFQSYISSIQESAIDPELDTEFASVFEISGSWRSSRNLPDDLHPQFHKGSQEMFEAARSGNMELAFEASSRLGCSKRWKIFPQIFRHRTNESRNLPRIFAGIGLV